MSETTKKEQENPKDEVSPAVRAYNEAKKDGGIGNLGGKSLEGMPKKETNPIGPLGGKEI